MEDCLLRLLGRWMVCAAIMDGVGFSFTVCLSPDRVASFDFLTNPDKRVYYLEWSPSLCSS